MKDYNYYMNLSYRMEIIEDPDEGKLCCIIHLPGALLAVKRFRAIANAKDAKSCMD